MAETDTERDSNVVIVDGVRYRKEDAPKSAPNKARSTASGSGSTQTAGKASTKGPGTSSGSGSGS